MTKQNFDRIFREATIQICSSLDIEVMLNRTLEYLQGIMPLRGIILHALDSRARVFTPVVSVSIQGKDRNYYQDVNTPQKVVKQLLIDEHAHRGTSKIQDLLIINNLLENPRFTPILDQMFARKPLFPLSLMILYLELEADAIGTLTFYTKGDKPYTEEHGQMIRLLKEPLTVAMSNVRRFQDLKDARAQLAEDNRYLNEQLCGPKRKELVGAQSGLKKVMSMVHQVAPLDSPVLLLGETGVGKENIAHAIHLNSTRRNKPFVVVNCGAIPDNLIDSLLFGYEKGAYTGATQRKRGRFERADGGTIFLDEIGELAPPAQVRLLRVIQEMRIERIGGSESIPINVRIIAATHRNLKEMTINGDFRKDLWFRLNVFPINVPPLRDRRDDVALLVHHFIQKKVREMQFRSLPIILPETIEQLTRYDWPGNVRELENMVERALIKIRGRQGKYLLTFDFLTDPQRVEPTQPTANFEKYQSMTLEESEAAYIEFILVETGGKIYGADGAAEILGVNPSTLRSKIKKLGIGT